VKRWKGRK